MVLYFLYSKVYIEYTMRSSLRDGGLTNYNGENEQSIYIKNNKSHKS